MAEALLCGLQDEFTCSLCLETPTDSVSLHCGHRFCLDCLVDYLEKSQLCRCRQCRHIFITKPEFYRNIVLNEVLREFNVTILSFPPSQKYAGPRNVVCGACTGRKSRARKSCVTCVPDYFWIRVHFQIAAKKHHKLIHQNENQKNKLCAKHQKWLDFFCKTDDTCICMMCGVTEHNGHEIVELEREIKEKQKQLGATVSEIKRRLEVREKTLKETRRVVKQMKENLKRFTDLMQCFEEAHETPVERIREQENKQIEKAEGVMEKLEREIEELKKKDAELKELSNTKDHVDFMQTFSSRSVLLADEDSLIFTVTADFSFDDLRKELSCLKKSVEKISQWDIMTFTPSGWEAPFFVLWPPEPQNREEILQYFFPLTLDINTAQWVLCLSEGNKKVTRERKVTKYPDHPDRFNGWEQVLCREALTGTRYYWEVESHGHFMMIGVAYKGLSRKGKGRECIIGYNDKSWSLQWSHSQFFVCHNNKRTVISAPYSPRIGVYLDWRAGSLSFYSVSHTMTLLHRFNTSFTEPLYPGFCLGTDCSITICHLTPGDH